MTEQATTNGAATPDTTIVLPVWGAHAAYLPEALASLRCAEGPAPEVIVVDNASDPPLKAPDGARVVRLERRLPIGQVRNAGLPHVTTPYVMFWDADDLALPGMLDRMREELRRDPGVVAVAMHSRRWTPETGPGDRWPWPRPIMYRLAPHRRALALISLMYNPFTTTGPALMRTDAVRDAGGFAEDIAFFEDWALSASLCVRGRICMLDEVGRLYRVHGDSLSLGHLDHPDQGAWLKGLRRRARRDRRTPLWLKATLPGVYVHHKLRERRRRRPGAGAGYYEAALKSSTPAG
ncbi:MAG TPA: glycosyltransferase family 2 protein [Baekduia sp.]|nr:glycosyltransferase family 2 protein [Baekduia sp.]